MSLGRTHLIGFDVIHWDETQITQSYWAAAPLVNAVEDRCLIHKPLSISLYKMFCFFLLFWQNQSYTHCMFSFLPAHLSRIATAAMTLSLRQRARMLSEYNLLPSFFGRAMCQVQRVLVPQASRIYPILWHSRSPPVLRLDYLI